MTGFGLLLFGLGLVSASQSMLVIRLFPFEFLGHRHRVVVSQGVSGPLMFGTLTCLLRRDSSANSSAGFDILASLLRFLIGFHLLLFLFRQMEFILRVAQTFPVGFQLLPLLAVFLRLQILGVIVFPGTGCFLSFSVFLFGEYLQFLSV